MKTTSKKFFALTLALAIVATPLASHAAATTTQKRERVGFCAKVTQITSTIQTRIDGMASKITASSSNRAANMDSKRVARDLALQTNRTAWLATRTVQYNNLLSKATTDVQKTAVNTFEVQIQKLIVDRKAAVDSAIHQFRTSVDSLLGTKVSMVTSAVATYKSDVDAAIAAANTACETTGVNDQNVRTTLRSSLKSAHDKFRASLGKGSFKTEIATYTDTRKSSVEAAMTEFKAAAETARKQMLQAFPTQTKTTATASSTN